jgi:hypothetical protein
MKKRVFLIIALINCFMIFSNAGCKDETIEINNSKTKVSISKIRWVTSKSGLRMRKRPNLQALRLRLIKFKEKVVFIEEEETQKEIDGIKGKWTKINYNNLTGWVFGGFLSKKEVK